VKGSQGFGRGELENLITYFKGTRDIFWIN